MDYSVVIPAYNEGGIMQTMDSIYNDVIVCNPILRCEVILVDDGSETHYFEKLLAVRDKYRQLVKLIKLTRNFGQASAVLAGFSHADGKCVIAMSADGQDPVYLINQMLQAHFQEHYEIVACNRCGRDESYYRILTSKVFYELMRKISFSQMPIGGFDFFLLGRRARDAILRNHEAHPFVQGQILWTGFKTKFIEYRREQRKEGVSHWTFSKKVTYLIDGLLSYSFMPIRLMSITGLFVALSGFVYATIILIGKLTIGNPIQGWTPLMIIVLVMGGVQMLMLGIIGEYLWRTLAQARNRDPYIIEAIFDTYDQVVDHHDLDRSNQQMRGVDVSENRIARMVSYNK
jgi:dolichol-phosphate mannosyltransferase